MSFQKSASSELFKTIHTLANKNNFDESKKLILDCVPKKNQGFLKEFEKFPEKALPLNNAIKWIKENIAYGADSIPSNFTKLCCNIVIGDDHVFYIDIECQDSNNNRIANMLNESMLVLETLSAEDYGFERLSSECDAWCDQDNQELKGFQYKGISINSRVIYDSFSTIVLLQYATKLQKALAEDKNFKKIQFINTVSFLNEDGKRAQIKSA
ncbi:MAG: hypothetical protein L6Q37_03100 [Bdellovibrionaceae bacterium]|nr:hypothetical protein [Pseudobdellovibrionaceae bacterium]NUM60491.1 hypothetical protein [Pseudobdellovibrionaceae bacterium]